MWSFESIGCGRVWPLPALKGWCFMVIRSPLRLSWLRNLGNLCNGWVVLDTWLCRSASSCRMRVNVLFLPNIEEDHFCGEIDNKILWILGIFMLVVSIFDNGLSLLWEKRCNWVEEGILKLCFFVGSATSICSEIFGFSFMERIRIELH